MYVDRHSLFAIWLKDEFNRMISPEIALYILQHPGPASEVILYPCDRCGISHMTQADLNSHVIKAHDGTELHSQSKSGVCADRPSKPCEPQKQDIREAQEDDSDSSVIQCSESDDDADEQPQNDPPTRWIVGNNSMVDLMDPDAPLQTFTCSICSQEECVNDGGVRHYFEVHGIEIQNPAASSRWPCIHCTLVFNTNNDLLQHLSSEHHVMENWTCMYCTRTFLRSRAFAIHTMGHVLMNSALEYDSLQVWRCFLCDFLGSDAKHILLHINNQHVTTKVTEKDLGACPRCGNHDLRVPMRLHLKRSCMACKEKFCLSEQLVDHQVTSHGAMDNWRCVQCGIHSSSKYNLKRHIQTIHEKEKWPCRRCKEVCSAKQYLINHLVNMHQKTQKQAENEVEKIQ